MLMRERTLINVSNFPVSRFENYSIIRIVIFNILFPFPLPPLFFLSKKTTRNNIISLRNKKKNIYIQNAGSNFNIHFLLPLEKCSKYRKYRIERYWAASSIRIFTNSVKTVIVTKGRSR